MDDSEDKKRELNWTKFIEGLGRSKNERSKFILKSDYDDSDDYWASMWPHIVGKQDIKPPGKRIEEKLDAETKKFLEIHGYYPPPDTGGPRDPKCRIHNWEVYEGFSSDFEFCTSCDLKRDSNKKEK